MEVQLDDEPMCLMAHCWHTTLIISVFYWCLPFAAGKSQSYGTCSPRREVSGHLPPSPHCAPSGRLYGVNKIQSLRDCRP